MDENTRQRNRRNVSQKEESDVINRRPRVSPQSLSAIISYISGNPDVKRRDSAKREDTTLHFSKFIGSEFEDENSQSGDTMKFGKKSDTVPKVSDSFPKTPTLIRRRRLEHIINVKNICLPDEEPGTATQPTNRKYVICTSKDMSAQSEAEEGIDPKKSTPTKRHPIPNDLQISTPADNEESNLSTSPVSSCESPDFFEEKTELDETPSERIASQVRGSLYEPSSVPKTPVAHHRRNTSKQDVAESILSSTDCAFYESSYSNTYLTQSYPEMQLRYLKNKMKSTCFDEREDSSGEPAQLISYPDFQTPPPMIQGQRSTHSSSRMVNLPVTENLRRAVHKSSWQTHSRSKSWSHSSTSSSQEEKRRSTSSNLIRLANWKKSQESSTQDSSKDTHDTFASPVSHRRHKLRYSPYDARSGRTRTHLQDVISRRSHEKLAEEVIHEGTMMRATSLQTVSLRSPQTQRRMEPPCFYHLSPDRVCLHALRQRDFEAYYSPKRTGDENLGYSSSISPYITWMPPQMRFLPPLYLPIQEPDDPLEPNLMGHQLLGDSQFLRFAKQILGKANRISDNMRYLGLCVSGQTIQELLQKIKAKFYPVGDKIILMIGTNNFLQNHRVDVIIHAWDELISHLLCEQSRRLLLLTVPPIPKLADNESHWKELDQVNTFIRGYAGGTKDVVTVADISSLFLSGPKQCCVDYFEKTYGDSDRVDLIHLNERGFARLHGFLTDNFML